LTALTAEFTVGEGELMTHDEPCSMAPDDKHDLISGTCSHLPYKNSQQEAHGDIDCMLSIYCISIIWPYEKTISICHN
ncbi:hypothetical protein ACET7H_20675, partial [Aeromonas veronii]